MTMSANIKTISRTSLLIVLLIYLLLGDGAAETVRNGTIAFADLGSTGIGQIFVINPDGSNRLQLTSMGENIYPSWSWDGKQIVFSSKRTGTFEIWRMDQNGSDQTQLTFNTSGVNVVPVWSPNGSKIAYASLQSSTGVPEVWIMNSDGSNQIQLTFTPVIPGVVNWSLLPSWSPDGTEIVYASTVSGSSQIWKMNEDGTGKTQMTNGNGPGFPDSNAPAWSRDGTSIAFWSGFETQFGEVWVMDANGTNKRKLTETIDPLNSDNPLWAPDGSKLLFDTNRDGPGILGIWMMESNGNSPKLLTPFSQGIPAGRGSWQPILGCCQTRGNIDGDPFGIVDITDLTTLIDHLFIGFHPLHCPEEGNVDGDCDNVVDITDLTLLIDHLFINFPQIPTCGI